MITIPSTNLTGIPVRRVTLLHSGGIGSTLVLYQLMKDIQDRNLNVGINCITLDTNERFKDRFFGASSAKECQNLLGFDSDKLIIQCFSPDRSVDSDAQQILNIEYFKFNVDSDAPLVKGTFREMFALESGPGHDIDSDDGQLFIDFFLNQPKFQWKYNVIYKPLYAQMQDADSDGNTALLDSLAATYSDFYIQTLNQFLVGNGLTEVVYTGNYRNPPTSVQSNFHSGQGVSAWEATHGYAQTIDSEYVDIDSEGHYFTSDQRVLHWWQKDPLMSKGDAKDLYDQFYSQDSDLETLFWYTRSCTNGFGEYYSYEEIFSDPNLLAQWDSETDLYLPTKDRFLYQYKEIPLHRLLPHCRKCWKCQNRGYGFEVWLDSENDSAWLRSENAFNPPPKPIPDSELLIFSFESGASAPGDVSGTIKNLGWIDGIADVLPVGIYDSQLEQYTIPSYSNNSAGIITQNLGPYIDSDGTQTVSIWMKHSGRSGTVFGDTHSIAGFVDYTCRLEVHDGLLLVGFKNKVDSRYVSLGYIDSDEYYHIVITYGNRTMDAYINGAIRGRISSYQRWMPDTQYRFLFGFSNYNHIYNFGALPPSKNDFSGSFKRISVWDRALTPDEIVGLYEAELLTLNL